MLIYFIYRYDRMFLPYPSKTNGISQQQHTDACKRIIFTKNYLKYLCKKSLSNNGFNIFDYEQKNLPQGD